MAFSSDLFDNIQPAHSESNVTASVYSSLKTSLESNNLNPPSDIRKTVSHPGRPKTGRMERVMCYFPKELLADMNHFSEEEMISRNAFIITCIVKHIRELKKEAI